MKMRISDLLDNYQEDALITEEATPLSMKRIEKMTMAAIKPQKRHPVRRFVPKVLAAAAMISLLTVTAIAEEREWKASDWFRSAVEKRVQQEQNIAQRNEQQWEPKESVDQYQLEAIDEHGKAVNQSVTQNGTTITLLALYGDEYALTLYFRVEAPEGTVLPDEGEYYFRDPSRQPGGPQLKVPAGYEFAGNRYPSPEAMPDDDPTDNQKDFVVTMSHMPDTRYKQTKTWQFHDEVPKTFTIWGLYRRTGYRKVGYSFHNVYEELVTGEFTFDITNAHTVQRKEIDVTGCEYSGHVQDGQNPETKEYSLDFTYTVYPERLTLSPFTAEVACRYASSGDVDYPVVDFQIVMKDGSSQRYTWWDGITNMSNESGDGWSSYIVQFMTPINLEQIDYVLIGDLEYGSTVHKIKP